MAKPWAHLEVRQPTGGMIDLWRCPERRVNYPWQQCPFTVQTLRQPDLEQRAKHLELVEVEKRKHLDVWHGTYAHEALKPVDMDAVERAVAEAKARLN